jgi:hypothetical protein
LDKNGIHYPNFLSLDDVSFVKTDQGNAFSLCYNLLKNKNITTCRHPDFTIDDFRQHLEKGRSPRDILISSEWVTALQREALGMLLNTIWSSGYGVDVGCVYRPLADFCISIYSQRARYNPSPLSFQEFFQDWRSWAMYPMGAVFSINQILSKRDQQVRFIKLSKPDAGKLETRVLDAFWDHAKEFADDLDYSKGLNSSLSNFAVMLQSRLKKEERQLSAIQINTLDAFLTKSIPDLYRIRLFSLSVDLQLRVFEQFYHALVDGFGGDVPASLDPSYLFSLAANLTELPGDKKAREEARELYIKVAHLLKSTSLELVDGGMKDRILAIVEEWLA